MKRPKGVYRFEYPSNTSKQYLLWITRHAEAWRKLLASVSIGPGFDA